MLFGGKGDETILGGPGDDLIAAGQGGNDILDGGSDNDEIWGTAEVKIKSLGQAQLSGGTGKDVFVIANNDLVRDLGQGETVRGRSSEPVQRQQNIATLSIPEKFGQAIQLSVQDNRLSDQVRQDLSELVKPENLAVMAGVLATWAGLTAVGGPVGVAANVALFGAGAVQTAKMLYDFVVTATQAETPEDLDRAAGHFAELVSAIGTDVLLGIVARPGKYADELLGLTQKFAPDIAKLTGRAKELSASLFKSAGNAFSKAGDAFARIGQGLTDIGQGIVSRVGDAVDDLADFIRGLTEPLLATEGGRLPGPGNRRPGRDRAIASSGAETVTSQVNRIAQRMNDLGVDHNRIRQMLDVASNNPKIRDVLDVILNSPGKLRNPDALQQAVLKSVRPGTQGVNDFRELELLASYIRQGHEVSLGGIADVVVHSTQPPRAVQLKNILTGDRQAIAQNLNKAANQLGGSGGEIIPRDPSGNPLYSRVAELIINNPQSSLYDKTPRQLVNELEKLFSEFPYLRESIKNVDEIRITNDNGLHPLKVIRGRDGQFQFITPTQTQPRQMSQNETSMLAKSANPELYAALQSINNLEQEQGILNKDLQTFSLDDASTADSPDFQTATKLAFVSQERLSQQGISTTAGDRTAVFDNGFSAIETPNRIQIQSGTELVVAMTKDTGELVLARALTTEERQQVDNMWQSQQTEPIAQNTSVQMSLDT